MKVQNNLINISPVITAKYHKIKTIWIFLPTSEDHRMQPSYSAAAFSKNSWRIWVRKHVCEWLWRRCSSCWTQSIRRSVSNLYSRKWCLIRSKPSASHKITIDWRLDLIRYRVVESVLEHQRTKSDSSWTWLWAAERTRAATNRWWTQKRRHILKRSYSTWETKVISS